MQWPWRSSSSPRLPVNLIGINVGMMVEYIEFVADHLLGSLGLEKHYKTPLTPLTGCGWRPGLELGNERNDEIHACRSNKCQHR